MELQFWIWLIIIVLTFLARARRKKPETGKESRDFRPEPPSGGQQLPESRPKPLTFDELLREIQAAKAPPVRKPEPARSYDVDYDDEIEDEEKNLETVQQDVPDGKPYVAYEEAKKAAFSRPSLEETMRLDDTVMKFSHFKGYESAENLSPLSDHLKEVHDAEGLRRAVVLSEILKRKF